MVERSTYGRIGLAALLAASAPISAAAQSPGHELEALLKRVGLRAVSPPSNAIDFTLPNLHGREVSLSDSHGRWVLLTFFATWCGPCATEMPSLERLHSARGDRGLDVIGIAIEPGVDRVAVFARDKGVTFSVLIDGNSQVATIYRASSIPTSYLITPEGKIAAVAQGARAWDRYADLVDDLLTLIPADGASPSAYASGQRPVELPSSLVPPDATIRVATPDPRARQPIDVDIRVQWAGDFEDYFLLPPEVHLPDGVEHLRTSASTSSTTGGAVITYRVSLQAAEAGTYALDPVELRYTPRLESQPVARRISGPILQIRAATIAGLRHWSLAILVAMMVVLTVGGFTLSWWRRRAAPAPTTDSSQHVLMAEHFAAAKRARLDGDVAGFIENIQNIWKVAGETPEAGTAALLERARYGGSTPPSPELDEMQRRTERMLAERTPDKASDNKPKIKLAHQPGDRTTA